jgi:hypothetical protein
MDQEQNGEDRKNNEDFWKWNNRKYST